MARSIVAAGDVIPGRLDREQHVGAGVAVGDRKHVEAIDLFVVMRQPIIGRTEERT